MSQKLFCIKSVLSHDQIKVVIRKTITCNNCHESHYIEEYQNLLKVNVVKDPSCAINDLLVEEVMEDLDCPVCSSKQSASLERRIMASGQYLIVHLKRYEFNDGRLVKDHKIVECLNGLILPLKMDEEINCTKSYHLIASICHSGTLAAGHYTAHVLQKDNNQWLLCNDKAVIPINSSQVNNKFCYVLFYELS